MSLSDKIITGINFLILWVGFVFGFTAYQVKNIWGNVDLLQILFFTHINCEGGK